MSGPTEDSTQRLRSFFGTKHDSDDLVERLEQLNAIGASLSAERDIDRLLEAILSAAKAITRADGGTLYRVTEERTLRFEIVRTTSLNYYLGGTSGNPVPFYPIQLYKDGQPNHGMVAANAALTGNTVNIADAYTADGFDFSGTRAFDTKTGYRSTSFLTVPMKNHENEIIGVLQLINATDPKTGALLPFSASDQSLAESLASQAAIALTNRMLINQLEALFESFINLMNTAIDEKSPYTGGHCQRVPQLTMMLAEAVTDTDEGPLADFRMTEKDRYELKIAGMLHDVSHTAFSHMTDWLDGQNIQEDGQDKNHDWFIRQSELPAILGKYGYDVDRMCDPHLFGLLERDAPDLCADRVDYALRESTPDVIDACTPHITAHGGQIVFTNKEAATAFGNHYSHLQNTVWGGFESASRYRLLGDALTIGIDEGVVTHKDLWLTDEVVLEKLATSRDTRVATILSLLLLPSLSHLPCVAKPLFKKFRHVDPLYLEDGELLRLSEQDTGYKTLLDSKRAENENGLFIVDVEAALAL